MFCRNDRRSRGHAFSSFAFTGANDEKVGLLGSQPGVAAAAQPDPGLSSFALSEGVLILVL
jgi:hypothetical protein